jgi:hypothetical protein
MLDGHRDAGLLAHSRQCASGTTLRLVSLHECLDDDPGRREAELDRVHHRGGMGFAAAFAEWPPRS